MRAIIARLRSSAQGVEGSNQHDRTGFTGQNTELYQSILKPLLVQTFGKPPELVDAAMTNYVVSFEDGGIDRATRDLIEQLKPILQAPIADHLGDKDGWPDAAMPMVAAFARIFQRYHFEEAPPAPLEEPHSYTVIGDHTSAA